MAVASSVGQISHGMAGGLRAREEAAGTAPQLSAGSDGAGNASASAIPQPGPVVIAIDAETQAAPSDILDEKRPDEHFIPVTRLALVERLIRPEVWPNGEAQQVARLFTYLDYWRRQQYAAALVHLERAYEPFNPDSDLFVTRIFTQAERAEMQAYVVAGVEQLLRQGNFISVPRDTVEEFISTKESIYGLDLTVDSEIFEDLLLFYRGASVKKEQRRRISRFFRKQEFEVPIFRRVFVLFKVKSPDKHIEDVKAKMGISREDAARLVARARHHLPAQMTEHVQDNIYLKMFKNLPRSELEMAFPNTQVRFRLKDKLWLCATGGGALGAGMFGAAGKLALAFSNPVTAAGAVGGLGMVLVRQIINVMNQKQQYMRVMAQNLYFHSMADNRGALSTLADRAAEEDFKEEILLYCVLAKERVNRSDLRLVDKAIEAFIDKTFNLQVDFDVADALERLMRDGLVREDREGTLHTLAPREAAMRIDALWDRILDDLPEITSVPGREADRPDGARP
jgi:hypothetical protein